MPTETEFWGILSVVRNAYPQLWPTLEILDLPTKMRPSFFANFAQYSNAYLHLRRTEEVDSKHSLSWWVDEIIRRLHGRQIDGAAFLAAVIGSRATSSFVQRDEYGNVWAFGLRYVPAVDRQPKPAGGVFWRVNFCRLSLEGLERLARDPASGSGPSNEIAIFLFSARGQSSLRAPGAVLQRSASLPDRAR